MANSVPLAIGEAVLNCLVHASWQAAALGLGVWLLCAALRRRLEPRTCFCLWLVVLARLLLPVTPPAPWSVFQFVPMTFTTTTADSLISEGVVRSPTAVPLPSGFVRIVADDPVGPVPAAPNGEGQALSPPTDINVQSLQPSDLVFGTRVSWLAGIWLVGVILLLVRQIWVHLQLHCQRRTWPDCSDFTVLDLFRRCKEELGVRHPVRLVIANGAFGPATFGVFRAIIVLPQSLVPQLSPSELRLVLLHELTHARRWDVLLDHVGAVVVAVHWFNPIAWLALVCLRRERELACDAAVLQHLGGQQSGHYGHTLLKVAESLS